MAYKADGRIDVRTWARLDGGNPLTTSYTYEPNTAELTGIDYSDLTPDVSFTYDRLGQIATVPDAVGEFGTKGPVRRVMMAMQPGQLERTET